MRRIVIYVLAAIIGASVGASGLPVVWELLRQTNSEWNQGWVNGIIGAIILLIIAFFLMKSILKALQKLDNQVASLNLLKLIYPTFGGILGLLVGLLISIPITMLHIPVLSSVIAALVIIFLGYLGYTVFNRRGEDIIHTIFRLIRRNKETNPVEKVEKDKRKKSLPSSMKLLDTSVIIDGRIFDIIKSGFLDGPIVIPNFVLLELQTLSDSNDSMKRAKGRRGLDFVNEIRQKEDIVISDKDYKDIQEVDTKLLRYATEAKCKLVTNDFNLNKLAEIQGIKVLNINDLANAVKQQVMVGDELSVLIMREGTERHQGIAYLPDGTMVVVEDTDQMIGKEVLASVTKSLQTSAGRMIFAELKNKN